MSASLEKVKHGAGEQENNNGIITGEHRVFDENFIALRTRHFLATLVASTFNIALIKIDQSPAFLFTRCIAVRRSAFT